MGGNKVTEALSAALEHFCFPMEVRPTGGTDGNMANCLSPLLVSLLHQATAEATPSSSPNALSHGHLVEAVV